MHEIRAVRAAWSIGNMTPHKSLAVAFLIFAVCVVFSSWPALTAEQIIDQESCESALSEAEAEIVGASIDSGTFRALNDQLVEMRTLCSQENFPGAETKLLAVMNALRDPR